MKGKIIKTDKEWMVEIQSDLHGYGIGWGDPMIYPLFITDENIWEGKEVEVEPIQYDSNFLPVIVKIKTNNMKPKTFEELFAGSGIEPTKDENGGVHYNFNTTLKNKPMIKQLEIEQPKLTEEQEEQQYWDSLKFNSHKWIEHTKGYYSCEFCNTNHTSVMPVNGHTLCSKNPHIHNQNK
jgi:hypothetical protein